MTSWTIVAIPSQGEPVWKASSEKVPHLTILYLGEQTSPELAQRIGDYVEHASRHLDRFGLSVDRRGTLGDEDADVLFFSKDFSERIREFRSQLLKNEDVERAYNSTFQYPSWTPHLTLGYPDRPANPTEYPISWVGFDRIALWTGDFEGPEYILNEQSMAQSESLENFLAHYGVKGMKWGVRRKNDDGGSGKSTKPKRMTRSEKKQARRAKKLAQYEADQKKAQSFLDTAIKKQDKVLIALNGNQIVTGKEFVDHLGRGGYMNVRTTRVYAETDGKGPYVLAPRDDS